MLLTYFDLTVIFKKKTVCNNFFYLKELGMFHILTIF